MLELGVPWLLALLPLPVAIWKWMPPYREARTAIRGPFLDRIEAVTGRRAERGAVVMRRSRVQMALAVVVWLLVVAAATRPAIVEDPIVKRVAARDLMLAVDLSGSMEKDDFEDQDGQRITRLDAVKLVLDEFIARREDDRIGLIVFGSAAYLQAPFTQDRETVRYLLAETSVRMAGPQTMLGDAIGFAITRFEESESTHRVLLLLTDGNDTGSRMPPATAAKIAADREVTIHAIAIGDPTTVGEEALDERALEDVAAATGGRFFRAYDRDQLEEVYAELDELEPGVFETLSWRPRRELWPLLLGTGTLLALVFVAGSVLRTHRREKGAARA